MLQPFGDDIHGCGADVFGKETFISAEFALADDVVEGSQGLARRSVHVGRYKMDQPIIGPLTPLHFLPDRKIKTHNNGRG